MSQKTQNKPSTSKRTPVAKGTDIGKKTGTGRQAIPKGTDIGKKTGN